MPRFSFSKVSLALFAFCAAMVISSSAQTFTLLATFDTTNGALPQGALVQGLDGNFYGVTQQGDLKHQCLGGCGTVFKITPSGTLTTIHFFIPTEGSYPMAGLLLATDGNFYGLTSGITPEDTPQPSIAFKMTPDGTLTVLSQLGFRAPAALIQDTANGDFYGVSGMVPQTPFNFAGTLFALTPGGTLTTLYTFCEKCGGQANGFDPLGSLVEDVSNGLFYGTALEGGVNCGPGITTGCGTVFVIGTGGSLKPLHRFTFLDGAGPTGALIQGIDGNFYGTTTGGGPQPSGLQGGSVFKMTPTGTLTSLYGFCSSCGAGWDPEGGIIQATDGNFYGTTYKGGSGTGPTCPCGTVYQLTPDGTFTTLHNFADVDGTFPSAALVQGTDGNLYGTTMGRIGGKTVSQGTIFKISLGLAPFVKTLPLAAHKGTQIFILGTDLTGATSVTFNGTPAAFTVVSATEITAIVPAGGTSGAVQVVTPSGTLSSNVPFRVY